MNKIIKSIADARSILKSLEIEDDLNENASISFRDSKICMMNGGSTQITRISEDVYTTFSSGQNWSDQQREEHDLEYCARYLWKARKNWNKNQQDDDY